MKGMLVVMMAAAIILSAGVVVWSDESPKLQPPEVRQMPIEPGLRVILPGEPSPRVDPEQRLMQVPPNVVFMPQPMCPSIALTRVMVPILAMDPGLGLSPEQIDKLRLALAKGEEAITPLREKAEKALDAFRDAMLADEYDAKRVQELATASAKAEAEVASAELDQWKQIRSILTTDQIRFVRKFATRQPMPGMPRIIAPTPGGQMMPGPNGPQPGGRPDLYAQ